MEEQVRKLGDELREVRELYEQEQERVRSTQEDMLQLRNQVHVKYTLAYYTEDRKEHYYSVAP